MRIADAHCDTLTTYPDNPFMSVKAHWDAERFKAAGGTLQYFAIFTPEEYSGDSAFYFAGRHAGLFHGFLGRHKSPRLSLLESAGNFDEDAINIVLALEGASPFVNRLENIHAFRKMGIRAVTLSWNHRNFLCDGVDNSAGLTAFGREAIAEMERLGMIIDVSHLNAAGFDDVAEAASKPFMASHSNARAVRPHRRNLADTQIKEIISRGGFIGINLYSDFLADEGEDSKKAICTHISHFLNLGGENVLGMGADFDGITSCPFADVSGYGEIAGMLKEDLLLDDVLIEKIMYGNLKEFTLRKLGEGR